MFAICHPPTLPRTFTGSQPCEYPTTASRSAQRAVCSAPLQAPIQPTTCHHLSDFQGPYSTKGTVSVYCTAKVNRRKPCICSLNNAFPRGLDSHLAFFPSLLPVRVFLSPYIESLCPNNCSHVSIKPTAMVSKQAKPHHLGSEHGE